MNQLNWTYLSDYGKRHQVGMMHGPVSGHLLVHCNSNIIIIDFSILDDKSYSFFIEEELCELKIQKEDGQFLYSFETNGQVNTPLNQARKKRNKRDLVQSLAFLGSILLLVIGVSIAVLSFNRDTSELTLDQKLGQLGEETHARVVQSPEGNEKQIEYFFIVDDKPYTVETPYTDGEGSFAKNGIPLEIGDEFVLKYMPNNPFLHKIAYDKPTSGTLERLKEVAFTAFRENHPKQSDSYSRCLTDLAYEKDGIFGLSKVYFAKTEASENELFNKEVFVQWTTSRDFAIAMAGRCSRE